MEESYQMDFSTSYASLKYSLTFTWGKMQPNESNNIIYNEPMCKYIFLCSMNVLGLLLSCLESEILQKVLGLLVFRKWDIAEGFGVVERETLQKVLELL